MKRLCFVSLLMLLAFNVKGQEKKSEDLNNMIISSIKSYIDDDYNTNYAGNVNKNKDSITYFIAIDGIPRTFPLDSLRNILFFTYHSKIRFKKFKKEFKQGTTALEIDIRTSDDKFSIGINSVNVIYKRKPYHKKITGRTVYLYEYSQEQKKWILIKKRNMDVSEKSEESNI